MSESRSTGPAGGSAPAGSGPLNDLEALGAGLSAAFRKVGSTLYRDPDLDVTRAGNGARVARMMRQVRALGILQVALTVVLLVLAVVVLAGCEGRGAGGPATATPTCGPVPGVVGFQVNEARELVEQAGYVFKDDPTPTSTQVLSQSPLIGAHDPCGSWVQVDR